jgi:CheY-like chemotaxis protein
MSFVFCLILIFVYFTKERINYVENKIYSFIILSTFLSCLVEIISFCFVRAGISSTDPIYEFILKSLFTCFMAWIYFLTLYTVVTGRKLRGVFDEKKLSIKRLSLIFFLIVVIILLLPIEILETNGLLLPVGLSVNIIYVVATLCIITMIISLVINRKNLRNKKYIPLYLVIVFFSIIVFVQKIFPELLLVNTGFALIAFCMFFTIENPDMKLVEELIENRKIIERASEEKSIFLFKISQGLREPVNNIDKQVALYKTEQVKKQDLDLLIQTIDRNNQKISYLINNVLGISSFDGSNIKKLENTYNIYSLLEDVRKRGQAYIKNKLDYNFAVPKNIPKELYGDSIKLKQVLLSVLINAIKNTQEGFVSVEVNSFTKYDTCRIVITVEDSGDGIDIVTINDIMDQDLELTEKDRIKMEKLDVDLPLAYKIIKSLGGTMHIKAGEIKGTEVTLTLDQHIVINEEIALNSKVDSYIKTRKNTKKVLIVDDDEEEIRKMKHALERKNYDVVISMFGQDAIDRVRNKEKYDIILIDDEMPLMNGINVVEEINKVKNKSKEIVLLNPDKLFIAKHYLKDGFDDYIDKSQLIEEINKKF